MGMVFEPSIKSGEYIISNSSTAYIGNDGVKVSLERATDLMKHGGSINVKDYVIKGDDTYEADIPINRTIQSLIACGKVSVALRECSNLLIRNDFYKTHVSVYKNEQDKNIKSDVLTELMKYSHLHYTMLTRIMNSEYPDMTTSISIAKNSIRYIADIRSRKSNGMCISYFLEDIRHRESSIEEALIDRIHRWYSEIGKGIVMIDCTDRNENYIEVGRETTIDIINEIEQKVK